MPGVQSFSPVDIFLHSDPVVQTIMVFLIVVSVVSWSVIINRGFAISDETKKATALGSKIDALAELGEAASAAASEDSAATRIFAATMAEWEWSAGNDVAEYERTRNRIQSAAELAIVKEGATLAGTASLLATIGATAPFVGLFGTVWGIMRSFIAIGQSHDTSLAVVAPGIAEALMATAIGLFCAIPAVVGYNRVLQGLGRVENAWRAIASRTEILISRRFETGRN